MKWNHLIVVFALLLPNISCSAEAPPPAPVAPAPAAPVASDPTPVQSKRVCIKVFDAKQNKEVEKCRTLKTHQKHDGTKVPEKK